MKTFDAMKSTVKHAAKGTGHALLGAGALTYVAGVFTWCGLKVVGSAALWVIEAKKEERKRLKKEAEEAGE